MGALVSGLFQIFYFLMIIYILLSWFPQARESKFGEIIGKIVEPYLSIFRKIIPPIGGMLDISPILAFLALTFVESGVHFLFEAIGLY